VDCSLCVCPLCTARGVMMSSPHLVFVLVALVVVVLCLPPSAAAASLPEDYVIVPGGTHVHKECVLHVASGTHLFHDPRTGDLMVCVCVCGVVCVCMCGVRWICVYGYVWMYVCL